MTNKGSGHVMLHAHHTHRNSPLKSEAAATIPHDYPGAADVLNTGSLYAAQHGKDFDADARAMAQKTKKASAYDCLDPDTRQFMSDVISTGGNIQSMTDDKMVKSIEDPLGRKLTRPERREVLKFNHALTDLPKPGTTATKQQLRNLNIVRKMTIDAEPSCR